MNREITESIADHGARCWQLGYAFWQVPPGYVSQFARDAWSRGYNRAALEFADIYHGRPGHEELRDSP